MADSQVLVQPYWVRFHTVFVDNAGGAPPVETRKAYAFLVTHEGPSDAGADQKWGTVWCNDENSGAGLAQGWNIKNDIGHGGPGSNASWSSFDEEA